METIKQEKRYGGLDIEQIIANLKETNKSLDRLQRRRDGMQKWADTPPSRD
jgi:hypothetical protein